jgi:hypothetical protein
VAARSDRVRHARLRLAGVLIVSVLTYLPVLWAGQVYEDRYYSRPSASVVLRPSRVLTSLTWQAQARSSDRVRHATNLAVHLVNGALVSGLAVTLGLTGWWVAGLFLLWPIQSEAVGYLAARADLLMTTGLLLTALAAARQRWALACVAAIVAMNCKEAGVAAFGMLLLWPHRPVWLIVTLGGIVALGLPLGLAMLGAYGSIGWIPQQAAGLGDQLTGLVLPWTLTLAPDPLPYSWLGTGALFTACGAVIAWSWAHPVRRLACLWIVSCLVLRFVIPTPNSVLNSHQMYAAMVGVCLWIGTFYGHAVQQG